MVDRSIASSLAGNRDAFARLEDSAHETANGFKPLLAICPAHRGIDPA
jgi:hypothetical protein